MGDAAVKIRIMPTSPDADLEAIESSAVKIIMEYHGKVAKTEKEPIAFGLNSIIITFAWDENSDQDPLEEALRAIENVSSTEIIDFRRISF